MSDIKSKITSAMKQAMRDKEKERLGVIRLMQAAFKQKEVDDRIELDDVSVLAILEKMLKQRRDSVEQYQKAKREDLVAKEEFEIEVIKEFMPSALSSGEIKIIVEEAVAECNALSMKDMGKVMSIIRPKLQGRADMAVVSDVVKSMITG